MDKWISVDDRLPKKIGMYLTFWDDGEMEVSRLGVESSGKFRFGDSHHSSVTHWMPLPDAPI